MKTQNKDSKVKDILHKVGDLIEEKPETPAEKPAEKPAEPVVKKPKERALIIYLSVLFSVAFLIVLLSYFSQRQNNAELKADNKSVLSRAEQLQDENRQLQDEKKELQKDLEAAAEDASRMSEDFRKSEQGYLDQISQLKAEHEEALQKQADKAKSYQLLIQANQAHESGNQQTFEKFMRDLEPLAHYLSGDVRELYQTLLEALETN